MKKSLNLLVITALLFNVNCFAQTKNIDVDNVRFSYSYRMTPETPLNPPNFKYWGKATTFSSIKGIDGEELADRIFINGQQKADSERDADVIITVRTGSVSVSNRTVNTHTHTSKDKDGKEYTTYSYDVSANYSMEGSYSIKQGSNILAENTVNPNRSWVSQSYNSYDAAAKYWNDSREAIVANWQKELSLYVADNASNYASAKWGFPVRSAGDLVKTMDEKKHDENITMRANVETLKRVLSAANINKPVNQDSIAPLIEYFKSIRTRYTDPKLKADDRLRYIANFNLCTIYLMLDQPEMVTQPANLISEGDYGKKDGAKLIKEAEKLKSFLEKSGIKTRHFYPLDYPALLKGEAPNAANQTNTDDDNASIQEDKPDNADE